MISASMALRRRLERYEAQIAELLADAERAEVEVARLREALSKVLGHVSACDCLSHSRAAWDICDECMSRRALPRLLRHRTRKGKP